MADLARMKNKTTGGVAELPDTDFWRDLGWEPVGEDVPTTDEVRELYDPSTGTVEEVAAYLAKSDDAERKRVIAAEKGADSPRKTVIEWTA